MSAEEWGEELLGALRVAVERRMVADVPVGVLLSGGFDSSLVVGLLAEAGQGGLSTFSIGFAAVGERTGDEFGTSTWWRAPSAPTTTASGSRRTACSPRSTGPSPP